MFVSENFLISMCKSSLTFVWHLCLCLGFWNQVHRYLWSSLFSDAERKGFYLPFPVIPLSLPFSLFSVSLSCMSVIFILRTCLYCWGLFMFDISAISSPQPYHSCWWNLLFATPLVPKYLWEISRKKCEEKATCVYVVSIFIALVIVVELQREKKEAY